MKQALYLIALLSMSIALWSFICLAGKIVHPKEMKEEFFK